MKFLKALFFSFLGLPLSALAGAPDLPVQLVTPVPSYLGFYGDINAGYGVVADNDRKVGRSSSYRSTVAGNANIGYQFHQNFAAEVGFNIWGNSNDRDRRNGVDCRRNFNNDGRCGSRDNYSFDIALKAILPLTEHLSFFDKLGGAVVHSKFVRNNGWVAPAFYYSGGFSYAFTPHFEFILAGTGTTERQNFKVPNEFMVTGGFGYHF